MTPLGVGVVCLNKINIFKLCQTRRVPDRVGLPDGYGRGSAPMPMGYLSGMGLLLWAVGEWVDPFTYRSWVW